MIRILDMILTAHGTWHRIPVWSTLTSHGNRTVLLCRHRYLDHTSRVSVSKSHVFRHPFIPYLTPTPKLYTLSDIDYSTLRQKQPRPEHPERLSQKGLSDAPSQESQFRMPKTTHHNTDTNKCGNPRNIPFQRSNASVFIFPLFESLVIGHLRLFLNTQSFHDEVLPILKKPGRREKLQKNDLIKTYEGSV